MALDKGLDNVAVHWPRTEPVLRPGRARRVRRLRRGRRTRRTIAAPTGALAAAHRQDRHGTGDRVHRAGRPAARPRGRAVRHRRRRRGRGPGDRPGRLRLDRRRAGTVRRGAPSRTATWSPSTPWRRCCVGALAGGRLAEQQLRWLERRLSALRDDAGDAPQWSFPRSSWPCWPASTAAAPTGASPSSPTTDAPAEQLGSSRRCRGGRGPAPGAGPRFQDGAAGPWMFSFVTTLWPTSAAMLLQQLAGEHAAAGWPRRSTRPRRSARRPPA